MDHLSSQNLKYSLLTGLIAASILAAIWLIYFPNSLPLGEPSLIEFFIVLLIISLGHEIIHLFCFPGGGLDGKSTLGIWLQTGSAYAQYTLPMSRNRFILATAMPFIFLSIFPFMFVLWGKLPVNFSSWISVTNCVVAGSDIFVCWKLLTSIPANAKVIESGTQLCWR
jgi:hypothetical protein